MINVNVLIGQTLKNVKNDNNEKLIFTTSDNKYYMLYHDQACCESVTIEDIVGNLNHLIGEPIVIAETVSNSFDPPLNKKDTHAQNCEYTWTYYKFATIKGYVDIRWYGTSNGCYSEKVDFAQCDEHGTKLVANL